MQVRYNSFVLITQIYHAICESSADQEVRGRLFTALTDTMQSLSLASMCLLQFDPAYQESKMGQSLVQYYPNTMQMLEHMRDIGMNIVDQWNNKPLQDLSVSRSTPMMFDVNGPVVDPWTLQLVDEGPLSPNVIQFLLSLKDAGKVVLSEDQEYRYHTFLPQVPEAVYYDTSNLGCVQEQYEQEEMGYALGQDYAPDAPEQIGYAPDAPEQIGYAQDAPEQIGYAPEQGYFQEQAGQPDIIFPLQSLETIDISRLMPDGTYVCSQCGTSRLTFERPRCSNCKYVEWALIEVSSEDEEDDRLRAVGLGASTQYAVHVEKQNIIDNPCWACGTCGYEYNMKNTHKECIKCHQSFVSEEPMAAPIVSLPVDPIPYNPNPYSPIVASTPIFPAPNPYVMQDVAIVQVDNPCWACGTCGYEYNIKNTHKECIKCHYRLDPTPPVHYIAQEVIAWQNPVPLTLPVFSSPIRQDIFIYRKRRSNSYTRYNNTKNNRRMKIKLEEGDRPIQDGFSEMIRLGLEESIMKIQQTCWQCQDCHCFLNLKVRYTRCVRCNKSCLKVTSGNIKQEMKLLLQSQKPTRNPKQIELPSLLRRHPYTIVPNVIDIWEKRVPQDLLYHNFRLFNMIAEYLYQDKASGDYIYTWCKLRLHVKNLNYQEFALWGQPMTYDITVPDKVLMQRCIIVFRWNEEMQCHRALIDKLYLRSDDDGSLILGNSRYRKMRVFFDCMPEQCFLPEGQVLKSL